MKIKTLLIIFLVYGLIFGSFYTFLKFSRVEEPLFLTHYYEKEIFDSSDDYVSIFYITNKGDQRQLVSAKSKELPGRQFYVDHDMIQYSEGIYNQHEALINLTNIEERDIMLENFLFEFSDGTSVETDIGAILLLEADRPGADEMVVDIPSSGSSNAGESFAAVNILKDSQLAAINLPYSNELTGFLDLKLDKSNSASISINPEPEEFKISGDMSGFPKDELPVSLIKGEMIRVNGFVDKTEMYENDIHALQIGITGTFLLNEKEVKQHLMYVTEQPYLTSTQIKELKELREEGPR
ncbi:hypothetical protein D3H55_18570 [Bacillus salacetis]|uniref:Uncharacterized protein n=1 Tax=Bacillus salacetis TaxID=2315464 RepID=A0A3A1QR22_9BACI|nr:hypothetical protein [Bacillus salacetis]RIW29603.1 hypothetical protein D3H55_18570 [Bacillus salacetis]